MQLGAYIYDNFINLYETLKAIFHNVQNQSIYKPDPTVCGKVEQAFKWCVDPFFNDHGLGENSARLIIEDAKNIASNHKDPQVNEDLMRNSHECELFVNKLSQLQHYNKSNGIEAIAIGKQLLERLELLGHKIAYALIQKFADDFIDVNFPLKKLSEIASSSFG
jgi:vinculin